MQFTYSAKSKTGSKTTGIIDAPDRLQAVANLRESGLYIVKMKELAKGNKLQLFKKHIPVKDKIMFTKHLGLMIGAGLSIIEALQSLEEETSSKLLSEVIADLKKEIEGGASLSGALEKQEKHFGGIYINMVKSGEKSGKVDEVLARLTEHLEKDYEIGKKIRGALSYPIFVLLAMTVVVTIVIIFVVPQLQAIFDDAGVELPIMTRIMIGTGMGLKKYGIYILAGLIVLIAVFIKWHRTPSGKKRIDRIILKIPIVDSLLKKSYMARFTRTFSSLSASELPLLDVFKFSGGVIGNIIYEEEVNGMAKKVSSGELVSVVFKKSPLFPKMISQLSAVGEKSGKIDEVFDTMADFYDKEIDSIAASLTTLLEPILMVVIGIGIALVILSVLQPIYGLVNTI